MFVFRDPAEDLREKFDLVKLLVRHNALTLFFKDDGVSMVDADMDAVGICLAKKK